MRTTTTTDQRRANVARMNASFAIEGFAPDAADRALQAQYIGGRASIDDLLQHAHSFAADHAAVCV